MYPQQIPNLRFPAALRRSAIARSVAIGAVVVLPAACGGSQDADVFSASSSESVVASTSTVSTSTVSPETSAAVAVETTAASTTAASTTGASVTEADQASAATGATAEAAREMIVDFTYAASDGGGRVRNPYIAVWIEDPDGNLVQTVSVWYESGKGEKWLPDLLTWYAVSGGQSADVSTGATRSAGSYSVVWDGTDLDGNPVAEGEYVLFLESAREHGPHSVTSAPISVTSSGFQISVPDNGELSGIAATLTA